MGSGWKRFFNKLRFGFLTIGLLAFLIQYILYSDTKHQDMVSIVSFISKIPAFVLAYYTSVLLHEAGHLLFGAIAGLKFYWVSVGGVQLYRDKRKLRLRFLKELNPFGGFAAMCPITEHLMRWRWIVFIVGGPLTSLLLFSGLWLLHSYIPRGTFLGLFITFTAWISLCGGILNLIPRRTDKFHNDGLQLLEYLRGGPHMTRSIAMTLLHSFVIEGKGCKHWNATWIEDSLAIQDNSSTEAFANFFAYDWALDRKEIAKAETYLNRGLELVEKLDPATTTALYWAQAYFLAIHKHDAVGARAALEKAGPNPLALAFHPLRSEAAVLFAEGYFEEARAKAQEGIKVYKDLGSPKHGQEEFDQLEDILTRAENSLALSSSMVA